MPFGVSKWPLPCDPRNPCFCLIGYAAGAVPPYKFFVQTTGALPPFERMNDGLLLTFEFDAGNECVYVGTIGLPALVVDIFAKALSVPPYDPAPASTLRWTLTITATATATTQIGTAEARLPDPVGQPPSILTLPAAGPNLIPNPVVILPRPWDAV